MEYISVGRIAGALTVSSRALVSVIFCVKVTFELKQSLVRSLAAKMATLDVNEALC